MHTREDNVTVGTGPDIERRIAHIAGVVIGEDARAADVAGEDAIDRLSGGVVLVVGRAGGQVAPLERAQADAAPAIAAVEPDLVAVAPTVVAQEVADGQVLYRHAIGLQDHDAVAPAGT